MAEYTNAALQVVAAGQNVTFGEEPVCGSRCIVHRDGSGIVTLRGITDQCRARYLAVFGANISIPTGGTVEEISVALAVDGEPLASAVAIVTPAAADEFFNVTVFALVDVPKGCCSTISVENTSTQPINVQNARLIVKREA